MVVKVKVRGIVATVPHYRMTGEGVQVATFMLRVPVDNPLLEVLDAGYEDDPHDYYTVAAFGDLAVRVFDRVCKGEDVTVAGAFYANRTIIDTASVYREGMEVL